MGEKTFFLRGGDVHRLTQPTRQLENGVAALCLTRTRWRKKTAAGSEEKGSKLTRYLERKRKECLSTGSELAGK